MQTDNSVDTRLVHVEKDVMTLQINEKEIIKELSSIREGQIETKIYVRLINESQALMSKTTKENQDKMLDIVQNIKDAPKNSWRDMSIGVKIGVYTFIITYACGFIGTIIVAVIKYATAVPAVH